MLAGIVAQGWQPDADVGSRAKKDDWPWCRCGIGGEPGAGDFDKSVDMGIESCVRNDAVTACSKGIGTVVYGGFEIV